MSSYIELALPLECAGINDRMNVNTQGLKETGKWQQRSRMRIDLCLIVGCGLSRVGGASRVRVGQGGSPGCGLTCYTFSDTVTRKIKPDCMPHARQNT